jgi:hypothetical protein
VHHNDLWLIEKEAKKRLVKDPFDDHMGKQALVGQPTCESLQPLKSYDVYMYSSNKTPFITNLTFITQITYFRYSLIYLQPSELFQVKWLNIRKYILTINMLSYYLYLILYFWLSSTRNCESFATSSKGYEL